MQRQEGGEDLGLVRLVGLVDNMVLWGRLHKLCLMDVLNLMNVMRMVAMWRRMVWWVNLMDLMDLVLTGIT